MRSISFDLGNSPEAVTLYQLQRRIEALEVATKRNAQDHLLLANATSKLAANRSQFLTDLMADNATEDELGCALECFIAELEVWCETWTPTSYTDPRISLLRIAERARSVLAATDKKMNLGATHA